ncbi:Hypothetical protein NTJ_01450 [Nesidiocoris tenuis]|uniref:Uncharacterized protein n=1 Tax=Nesidiocoris tenuis TaxID=355587 RepID=A0ABN7A9I9_9HEMI|nr:Hypothetical protein NTJ_01450 [Nesidiocoris tenuis]
MSPVGNQMKLSRRNQNWPSSVLDNDGGVQSRQVSACSTPIAAPQANYKLVRRPATDESIQWERGEVLLTDGTPGERGNDLPSPSDAE